MKEGDLVRYKLRSGFERLCEEQNHTIRIGLLIEFNTIQRLCIILDNITGELHKRHCSDVQLVKVGHASR